MQLACAQDGRHAATASLDHTVRLWDIKTHRCVALFAGLHGPCSGLAFSPDGRYLVASTNQLEGWDLLTETALRFEPLAEPLAAVAFHPDGTVVVTAGLDAKVRVWEVATGRCLRVLPGHEGAVLAVACSADGRWAWSGGRDGTVRRWEFDWELEAGPREQRPVTWPEVGSEATFLEAVDRKDYAAARAVRGFAGDPRALSKSHRGELAGGWPGASLSLPESAMWLAPLAINWFAVAYETRVELYKFGRARSNVLYGSAEMDGLWGEPAGKSLLTAHGDGTLIVWDVTQNNARAHTLNGPPGRVRAAAWSADGHRVASLGADSRVLLWDVPREQNRVVASTHKDGDARDSFEALAFFPDGRHLLMGRRSGEIGVWDSWQAEQLRNFEGEGRHPVMAPDGRHAAAEDGLKIGVWDVATGRRRHTLEGHTETVSALLFWGHGRTLASASRDGTVRLWDVDSGRCLGVLRGHRGVVSALAMTPEGDLLSTGRDARVRRWQLDWRAPAQPHGSLITVARRALAKLPSEEAQRVDKLLARVLETGTDEAAEALTDLLFELE